MKKNLPSLLLLSFSLTACGGDGSSSNDDNQYYGQFPYDYPQYQDALDIADLQKNDGTIKTASNFSDFDSDYFSIDSTANWLTFDIDGEDSQSILKFTTGFQTDEQHFHRLSAALYPMAPNTSIAESDSGQSMTLLQIANDQDYAPLVSITWDAEERESSGSAEALHSNSYWAVINTGQCTDTEVEATPSDCYTYYHLANYNTASPTQFELLVENNQLVINVDQQEQVNLSISNWPNIDNYFTAGVTNHYSNGNSTVQYKTLTYNTNLPIADLNAANAPSDNFDLLDWYLSIPEDSGQGDGYRKATSIKATDLDDSYENDEYFYTASDGGMTFICPIDGARTSENTSYTRTELRGMLSRGNSTSTKSMDNNWVFSSASQSAQNDAAGVDGVLEATVAVNHVTTSGDSDQRGRVIIGQIHANDDEPIRLYYRLLPGHSKGSIYFAHEPKSGSEQWINMIGSRNDSGSQPSDGIALDEKFYYKIKVQGNLLIVTIKRDYKDDITKTWDMSGSGFDDEDQYMYFKAGVYNQNKSGNDDDFVQATFYYLENQHSGYSNN